jgi:hypothetical protein
MSVLRIIFGFLLVGAVPVLAAGCGGQAAVDPKVHRSKAELGEFYEVYMTYAKNNQRPPKGASDLKQYQKLYPTGMQAVQKGDYVVVWGTPTGSSETVLAYEKDAPKQGGAVLMADGTIKQMSAEDLQSALITKG